jgi:uncharacterized protein (TIGR03435 family)
MDLTVSKYASLDEMKADKYRYWQSRPVHDGMGRTPVLGVWAMLILALCSITRAQSGPIDFEAASVKLSPQVLSSGNGHGTTGVSVWSDPAMLRYSGVSLKWLIVEAFRTNEFAVSGPSWIDSTKYDVAAKLPDAARKSDIPAMLQRLLIDRFHLVVRQEEKTKRDYALVVAKQGLFLKKSDGADGAAAESFSFGMDGVTVTNVTLGRLAEIVGKLSRTSVLDDTDVSRELCNR